MERLRKLFVQAFNRLEEWDNIASAALMSPRPTLEWLDRLETSQREMNEIFMQEIEARRRTPGTDLITELLNAAEGGDRLSHEEPTFTAALVFRGVASLKVRFRQCA